MSAARREYGAISLAEAVQQLVPDTRVDVVSTGVLDSETTDLDAVAAAVREADVVILALGGRPGWFGSALTEGEGSDTADVALPQGQNAIVDLVADTGIPAVDVVYTGRPFAIPTVAERIPAVLWAYYGGQRANQAVAAALFGDLPPAGRLPYSIPRHSGQLPLYAGQPNKSGYRKSEANTNLNYLAMPATPLFPFGYGLTYTTFAYGEAIAPQDEIGTNEETISIDVQVTNTGNLVGDEVVQLYASTRATGVTRPTQQLVSFLRLGLKPGETAEVHFEVPLALVAHLDEERRFVVESGTVEFLVASSSDDIRSRRSVTLHGPTRELAPHERQFVSSASCSATSTFKPNLIGAASAAYSHANSNERSGPIGAIRGYEEPLAAPQVLDDSLLGTGQSPDQVAMVAGGV